MGQRFSCCKGLRSTFEKQIQKQAGKASQHVLKPPNQSSLYDSLPNELKPYSSSVFVTYNFWEENVEKMNEKLDIALSVYDHVFKQLPSALKLFSCPIEEQAKKFLNMFDWLIKRLIEPDQSELVNTLKRLGDFHDKKGIKPFHYQVLLGSFHAAMKKHFPDAYSNRVRFCMEQVYTVVSNIMSKQDLNNLFLGTNDNRIELYLNNLNSCIRHPDGSRYLKMFMKERFCLELYLFVMDYLDYVSSDPAKRKPLGEKMMREYIQAGSESEINISWEIRRDLVANSINIGDDGTLFDMAYDEVMRMISENIWTGFRVYLCKLSKLDIEELDLRISSLSSTESPNKNKLSTKIR